MSLPLYFGRVVKQLREELRLSQELLADRANLNRTYLGEVERGVATPSLITIVKISKALNISASDLGLVSFIISNRFNLFTGASVNVRK